MPKGIYQRKPRNVLADRFWIKVHKGDTGDCWLWGGYTRDGYGKFLANRRLRLAHRIAWELTHGPIPEGLCVCHSCDNPRCCNPVHLFLGSRGDNNRDRAQKGRTRSANAAKTHCRRGHPYDDQNTSWSDGKRWCKTCKRDHERRKRETRKAQATAVQTGN
jgi:hypothetical protein